MKRFATTIVSTVLLVLVASFGTIQAENNAGSPEVRVDLQNEGSYTIKTSNLGLTEIMLPYVVTNQTVVMSNLIQFIEDLTANNGKNGGAAQAALQMIDGTTITLLVVSATEKMHEGIAQTIERINQGDITMLSPGINAFHYSPKFRPAKQFAEILGRESTLSVGYVYYDEEVNLVTAVDDICYFPYFQGIMDAYDVPVKQVEVEIMVIETKHGDSSQLGIDWNAWKKALPNSVSVAMAGQSSVDSFEVFLENLSPQALAQFLNYLKQKGFARVESRTTLNVLNAQTVTFKAGQDVQYQLLVKTGPINELENLTVFEGLELHIKAMIAQKVINLQIEAGSSSVVGFSESGAPQLSTSHLNTAVDIEGEETFVLSGLKRQSEITSTQAMPYLGQIPYLKWLFSKKKTSQQEWDVTILVKVRPK